MLSETIWSSGSPHSSNYRTVLDQVDPSVAKLLATSSSLTLLVGAGASAEARRFSFQDSDGIFSFNKESLHGVRTSYAASTGGAHHPVHGPNAQAPQQPINLGTASISGGIASRHPPKELFLQKFASVADATREIELANNLGSLSLDQTSRRTSFNTDRKPLEVGGGFLSSPHGSLNENLNMPVPRSTSRHQSISEKIDNYNSHNSPIQASASLSILSDLNSAAPVSSVNNTSGPSSPHQAPGNFWNPATATPFQPTQYNYFMDQSGLYRPNMGPISPPPFMMPAMPAPPPQFVDPSMYSMMGYGVPPTEEKKDEKDKDDTPKSGAHTPGIGLMNRQMPSPGFMFQGFAPYVYQTSPPPQPSPPRKLPEPTKKKNSPVAAAPTRRKKEPKHNHIYRSPLLEEVRANTKGKNHQLRDIYGHGVEFIKDQHGSRFIQQKLPTASEEEKEVIFNEIRPIAYELMTDVFGNYVIQKFFEHGNSTQRKVLLETMLGHIYDLSLHMYGCRVVQRALEAINVQGQIQIVDELRDYVLVCAKDQNGNHVIQKSIEKIPFEEVRFILTSLENQIYHLSTHPYGCRVVQRLLEFSTVDDQKRILKELNRFIFYLIQDQYGNYVMQHILERGHAVDRDEIFKVVQGLVVNFSKHKFASNVIEKCIKHGTLDQRKQILVEVLAGNEKPDVELVDDDSALALMVKDQYANYVIQKLVEGFHPKSDEKKRLVSKLRQYLKQISSKNSYGKHLALVEKMIIVAENALVDAEKPNIYC